MLKTTLIIAACAGFLLLSGCNRCDMWGWYKECDLIEGRTRGTCCPQPLNCSGRPYRPGEVVRREIAVPATPCTAPVGSTVTEMPPPQITDAEIIDAEIIDAGVIEPLAPPAEQPIYPTTE